MKHPFDSGLIECGFCGSEIRGRTRREVLEDARNLGWKHRGDYFLCPDCITEMENLS